MKFLFVSIAPKYVNSEIL